MHSIIFLEFGEELAGHKNVPHGPRIENSWCRECSNRTMNNQTGIIQSSDSNTVLE